MSSLSKMTFSSLPSAMIFSHHLLHPSMCTFSFGEHLHMEPPYLCLISHWVVLCSKCLFCVILSSQLEAESLRAESSSAGLINSHKPTGLSSDEHRLYPDWTGLYTFAQSLWCPKALARGLILIKITQVWCSGLTHVPEWGLRLILDQGTCSCWGLNS